MVIVYSDEVAIFKSKVFELTGLKRPIFRCQNTEGQNSVLPGQKLLITFPPGNPVLHSALD